MLKFIYPSGTHCYRALHSVHAVWRSDEGKLVARAEKPDQSGMYEFEIPVLSFWNRALSMPDGDKAQASHVSLPHKAQ